MDLVDILPDVKYWAEDLCCTILTHMSDLEVKVTDFEILSLLREITGALSLINLEVKVTVFEILR